MVGLIPETNETIRDFQVAQFRETMYCTVRTYWTYLYQGLYLCTVPGICTVPGTVHYSTVPTVRYVQYCKEGAKRDIFEGIMQYVCQVKAFSHNSETHDRKDCLIKSMMMQPAATIAPNLGTNGSTMIFFLWPSY
jgi:hypothetical protein